MTSWPPPQLPQPIESDNTGLWIALLIGFIAVVLIGMAYLGAQLVF